MLINGKPGMSQLNNYSLHENFGSLDIEKLTTKCRFKESSEISFKKFSDSQIGNEPVENFGDNPIFG